MDYEILQGADDPDADFAVYPVTREFLPALAKWPHPGPHRHGWISHSHTASGPTIRPGDLVSLRVWDSTENSLLTATEQQAVDLSDIEVSKTGAIFMPYVGDLNIAGKTTDQARLHIQTALEGIIPSAQVQLSVVPGRKNSVDLVGGVTKPGTYPVVDDHFTVLGLLAAGGGVMPSLVNPQVRLIRNGRSYETSIDRLYETPSKNSLLIGGDTLIVEEDERYFLSYGSTGQEALHRFPKDTVSALDAVSIMSGINDARGDPEGVLILREYPANAVGSSPDRPRMQRVVFTFDLTTSDGLFSAGRFQIASGDLLVGTESPVTNVRTVLGLIGLAVGAAAAVD
ncbi:polysaccharide biosynthesis/export family protein [Aestuariivita boseongensis]|uniref:polysaccharide biosynthesis/export family protein n=1 Tax=Aestuariivita boseongensis TaxID=1470562 RepID=UPI001FDF3D4D|nr:polysaccharide biosynthesis/export family protein [Aestuariivita boseongensis]